MANMILFKHVPTKRLRKNSTPDSFKTGVEAGASIYPDLGGLIELCRKGGGRRSWSIGMVECDEADVTLDPSFPNGRYKTNHYIPLTENYIPWQQAQIKYQDHLQDA